MLEIYIQQKQIEKVKADMFLQIPSFCQENRNLHCIISPRTHHQQTLINLNYQNNRISSFDNKKRIQSFKNRFISPKNAQIQRQKSFQSDIDLMVRPFQLMVNSKSSHLRHSKSLSDQFSQNKFYSFKKIREDRCKEQSFGRNVIKSLKINSENNKTSIKKVIQHLDQVTTIESKDSPRSSLNSLFSPQIQQSLIIMKGADLYDELLKQNKITKSGHFLPQTKLQNSIYKTPQVRKELCESGYWLNRQNTVIYQGKNCFTDPKKIMSFEEKAVGLNEERNNIHNLFRYFNSNTVENNKLSFLKAKKIDRK